MNENFNPYRICRVCKKAASRTTVLLVDQGDYICTACDEAERLAKAADISVADAKLKIKRDYEFWEDIKKRKRAAK